MPVSDLLADPWKCFYEASKWASLLSDNVSLSQATSSMSSYERVFFNISHLYDEHLSMMCISSLCPLIEEDSLQFCFSLNHYQDCFLLHSAPLPYSRPTESVKTITINLLSGGANRSVNIYIHEPTRAGPSPPTSAPPWSTLEEEGGGREATSQSEAHEFDSQFYLS